jgi:predicted DCC family thiol-disulfide oxidoreductase YuxK
MQAGSFKYTLAYDAYCGPCTKFKQLVNMLDKHEKIDYVSLVAADHGGMLDAVAPNLRYASFHLVLPGGIVKSGSEALMELIAILPCGRIVAPVMRRMPGSKALLAAIYGALSRLHDRGSCKRPL